MYCIIASILLLSHVQLFKNLTQKGYIESRKRGAKYVGIVFNGHEWQSASPDLGGGMIGALLFAASYFSVCVDWFSDHGNCHDFDRNDFSNRTVAARNAKKVDEPDWTFYERTMVSIY